MNTAHVVKTTEAFKQWEYRAGKGNGEERKRRGDESPIIDDDDEDDEDEDEEERGSPVIEDATCPFKKSYEDEEDDEVSETLKIIRVQKGLLLSSLRKKHII